MNLLKITITFLLITTSILFAQKKQSFISSYDFSKSKQTINLNKDLGDISDMLEVEDKLFVITSGSGKLYEVNKNNGKIINSLRIADETRKEKFESICAVGKNYFLVNKSGDLSELSLTAEKGFVRQKEYSTKLNERNYVSGVTYDSKNNQLLLLCKDEPGFALRGVKAIYLFDMKEKKLENFPSIMIHLSELKKKYDLNEFFPADIEYNPSNGNIIVISSKEPAVIEISMRGEIMDCIKLDKQHHSNPQSITLAKDGAIIISDSASGGNSKLTYYQKR